MRETRSEGCHWGKTASGVARIRGEGGAAELRREALLWKEREGEQLVVVVVLEGALSGVRWDEVTFGQRICKSCLFYIKLC